MSLRLNTTDCFLVYLCHNGTTFANTLVELSDHAGNECNPIFAFFDVDFSGEESNLARRKATRASWIDNGPPSPGSIHRTFTFSTQSDEARGLSLLSGISNDIQVQEGPKLIIPIAVLRLPSPDTPAENVGPTSDPLSRGPLTLEHKQIARCLDAGAVDVLTTPLDRARIQGLVVHAYRTRKAAQREMSGFLARRKLRKLSWVGVNNNEQPYSYLREAMVSKLMKGICNPEEVISEFQEGELTLNLTVCLLSKSSWVAGNFQPMNLPKMSWCLVLVKSYSMLSLCQV